MKKIIITLLVMFALLQTSFVVHAEDGFSGFSGVDQIICGEAMIKIDSHL